MAEYYMVQKKGQPYVKGGVWCADIVVSSSVNGAMFKDTIVGFKKGEVSNIKKGDIYKPKADKQLEPFENKK